MHTYTHAGPWRKLSSFDYYCLSFRRLNSFVTVDNGRSRIESRRFVEEANSLSAASLDQTFACSKEASTLAYRTRMTC